MTHLKFLLDKNYREVVEPYTTIICMEGFFDRIVIYTYLMAIDKNIIYDGIEFSGTIFDGVGKIDNLVVNCINAESQTEFHRGYEFKDKDIQDVKLLSRSV